MNSFNTRITSGEMYFYYDSVHAGIPMQVYLDQEVDGAVLEKALEKTLTVHPYLTWTLQEENGDFYLSRPPLGAASDIPRGRDPRISLTAGERYPELGFRGAGPSSAGAPEPCDDARPAPTPCLASVRYCGNTIGLSFFHGLMDGLAAKRVMETVLYFYFCEKDSADYPSDGIMTMPAGKYPGLFAEPYAGKYPLSAPERSVPSAEPSDLFSLAGMPENSGSERVIQVVRIPSGRLMAYSRRNGMSPSIAIGLLAVKAIQALHPDNKKIVRINIPVSFREALGIPDTFKNATTDVALYVDPSRLAALQNEEEMQTLGAELRKELKEMLDPDRLRFSADSAMDFLALAAQNRSYEARYAFYNSLTPPTADTIFISYMGKINAPGYGKHLTGCDCATMPRDGFVFNIYDCGESFNISLIKYGADSTYINAFLNVCSREELPAELVRSEEYRLERVYIR